MRATGRKRRWILRGVGFLLAGAGASLLSAWIPAGVTGWKAAANTPLPVLCESTPPGESAPRVLFSWVTPAQQSWRTYAPAELAADAAATFVDEPSHVTGTTKVDWPYFFPVPEVKPGFEICSDASGWPWMCMQRITTFQSLSPTSVQVDVGAGREVWMFQVDKKWYMIPLRVIWPGFLGNAAVFAAAIGVVWLGPGAVRRAVRRARGRCEACGYSMAGVVRKCPECGAIVRDVKGSG